MESSIAYCPNKSQRQEKRTGISGVFLKSRFKALLSVHADLGRAESTSRMLQEKHAKPASQSSVRQSSMEARIRTQKISGVHVFQSGGIYLEDSGSLSTPQQAARLLEIMRAHSDIFGPLLRIVDEKYLLAFISAREEVYRLKQRGNRLEEPAQGHAVRRIRGFAYIGDEFPAHDDTEQYSLFAHSSLFAKSLPQDHFFNHIMVLAKEYYANDWNLSLTALEEDLVFLLEASPERERIDFSGNSKIAARFSKREKGQF